MSGVRVTYNLTKPSLSRVVEVHVLCASCAVPSYSPLDLKATYKIIVSSFLQFGGDGYDMLKVGIIAQRFIFYMLCLSQYGNSFDRFWF